MKTLIVVDMQRDFIDGALGTAEAVAIVPNVKAKIKEYAERGDEIIFTRDTHTKEYLSTNEGVHLPVIHCVKDTDGWRIPDEIDIPECEHIDKPSFGWNLWGYRVTPSGKIIPRDKVFEEIEIIGLCTDICVVSNALILKATYPEINISVDANCCAGVTPESHKAALATMRSCQINIIKE